MPGIFSSRKGPRELAITDNIREIENAQRSPIGDYPTRAQIKPRQSLAEAWLDADVRFRLATKNRRSLRDVGPQSVDAYLEQWAAKCEVHDSDDARRKTQMICVLSNILDGIDVVGGIVAGGASLAFPPASACFGAISFLIDMPRQIEKVYDTLLVLFAEVEEFLVRFKILKRIDDKQRLEAAMIDEASRMLLSFVDVCILSIKLLEEHKISTAFKAALLKNDSGVGAALEGFRRLAKSLDSLTSTVAFEHILIVEETVKEVNVGFKSIVASNKETRIEQINAERLRSIEAKIFDQTEHSLWEEFARLTKYPRSEYPLPSTCDVLESHAEFQRWSDSTANRAFLFLLGEEGTGKSYMVQSLRERLEILRMLSDTEEEKTYVAFHAFNAQRTRATGSKGQGDSRIPFALRSMALQVAAQNTLYAKDLEAMLRDDRKIKNINECKSLWQILRLSTLKAPTGSTMYLLFDGLDQETDIVAISELYKILASTGAEKSEEQTRIRVVITSAPAKVKMMTGPTVSRIEMSALTKTLMPTFMTNEMKRLDIFQGFDKKSKAQYQKVVQGLGAEGSDSFKDVTKKLERIQIAIQDDLPSSALEDIITNEDNQVGTEQAKQLLDNIASTMMPVYISQANQIITWILYVQSGYAMEIEELELILLLQKDHDTLNTLDKKIDLHFKDLFYKLDGCLLLKPGLEDALRESESLLSEPSEKQRPLITMDISIANSDDTVVRSFFADLNAHINKQGYDFRFGKEAAASTIHANKLKGHLDIIWLCFKLLNDGWCLRKEAESMAWYAIEWLPKHLAVVAAIQKEDPSQISTDNLRMIGQGLVGLLSEPYDLITANDVGFGSGSQWIVDAECIDAVRLWLALTKETLQARERRWIDAALDDRNGRLGFMKDFARAVGRKWATNSEGPLYSIYIWLDSYIEHVGDCSGETAGVVDQPADPLQLAHESTARETTTSDAEPCHSEVYVENSSETTKAEAAVPSVLSTCAQPDEVQNTSLPLVRSQSDNKHDPVPIGLQPQQKVQRAIDWVEREVIDVKHDGVFNANIAFTYYCMDETSRAIEYYEKAREDPVTYRRALIGLGKVKKEKEATKEEAVKHILEAIHSMDQDLEEHKFEGNEFDSYFDLLEQAGVLLDELGRTSDAVSLFERCLKVNANVEMMFTTLRLLCKAKREIDAIALLERWTETDLHMSLSECILLCVDKYQTFRKFEKMMRAVQEPKLRTIITMGLEEAIDVAEQKYGSNAKSRLLHLYAMNVAAGLDKDRRQIASDLWDDVLRTLGPSMQLWWDRLTIFAAARGATGYRFDQARAKLLANPEMSSAQQDEICRELHEYTLQLDAAPQLGSMGRLSSPERYAHAMNILLGRINDVRNIISEDMQVALDILTDDDKTNDIFGINSLIHVSNFMGDKATALTAFSLYDRQRLRAQKEGNGSNNENDSIEVNTDSESRGCDGCFGDITSTDTDGFWCCQFCPNLDLCTACQTGLVSGELRLPFCNPNHEFIHLYHTEYESEEVEADNVRIDWEYIQLQDGKFERKGGRIVKLSEWVEQLRKAWVIPEAEEKSGQDE